MKGEINDREGGLSVCWCLHDDFWHLELSVRSFQGLPKIALISKLAWDGSSGNWEATVKLCEAHGVKVILGEWSDEQAHRRAALEYLREQLIEYAIIPDGDEVVSPELLDRLIKLASGRLADRVHVQMDTYWKSTEFVIRPRENLEPLLMIRPAVVDHVYTREYRGGAKLTLDASSGVMHHLSYCGPDERIQRKISTWGHRDEVVDNWYENVWIKWDKDPLMHHLHPTHPSAYGFAERIAVPEVLRIGPAKEADPVKKYAPWPTISVVIPVCSQAEDVKLCLESLESISDLIGEVIVVDNGSDQETKNVLASHPEIKLIHNDENLGFAGASNQGLEGSTGTVILFLNSDTVVPRAGFIPLIHSLMQSGSIGAAGPMSNQVGYYQRINSTYTSLETLELFAQHWSQLGQHDAEVEMLVGFCLAVKKSVLDEIGGFDESFGVGLFEDTDLCYRIQRAGYRLKLAWGAFVHHSGSKTLREVVERPAELLAKNGTIFMHKWRHDLDSGFASHLPGGPKALGPIRFNPAIDPLSPNSEVAKLREQANISLCMIVRNEQRVLEACLRSAKPFFKEIIIVDTGSSDDTIEIAKRFTTKVIEMEWPDSFALARNRSLEEAAGQWIFWLDADDTLPWASGMALLEAAVNAPKRIAGFVVPVQFVEDSPAGGTRVDHVKLFRNRPEVRFEGRIHEQVLRSLNPFGEIARLDAVVMHSGYDTSEEGQTKKRERDWHLLGLDLAERPDHPFVFFNYGMTSHFCNMHSEAIGWLEKCLEASGETDSHIRKAYAFMGISFKCLGEMDRAEATFLKGIAHVGDDPELRFNLGLLFAEQSRWEEAKEHYELIQDAVGQHFSSIDIGILNFKKHFNLGTVHRVLGDYVSATRCFRLALEADPGSHAATAALFEIALLQSDFATARQIRDIVQADQGRSEFWANLAFELVVASQGLWEGLNYLRGLAHKYPAKMGPQIVLARNLARNDRVGEALPLLRALTDAGSAEAAYYLGVAAVQAGRLQEGLAWMKQSEKLNPGHLETLSQINILEAELLNFG